MRAEGIEVTRRSAMYETDPVGGPPDQTPYVNEVVEIEFEGSLRGLFSATSRIEAAMGRDRDTELRWGPRPIDIDILVAEETADEDDLVVPHPRAHERAFVLVPLSELAPDLGLDGGTVAEHLDRLRSRHWVRKLGS
jgi:2-amino-4-hydroxy-6-hydroxymethyldihydropteridine diphosphokinase